MGIEHTWGIMVRMGDALTSAESWDAIWTRHQQAAAPSRLRSNMKMQRQWRRLQQHLLASTPVGSSLLELGCAPGEMLSQVSRIRPDLELGGIDYAPAGLEIARQRLAGLGLDARLAVADMRDPQPSMQADVVVSFGLIEHFDPVEALRCHYNFVRPGGRVAVTVPNYAHPLVQKLLARWSPETLETHDLAIMSTGAMRQSLEQAGFTSVIVGEAGPASLPSSRVRRSASGRAYRQAARGWNLLTEVIPETWPWSSSVWGMGERPSSPG